MEKVGEVNISNRLDIEWRISYFYNLMEMSCTDFYFSPLFHFADAFWRLSIYPNLIVDNSVRSIAIFLQRESCGSPITLKYSFSLKTLDETKYGEKNDALTFKGRIGRGISYLSRNELLERKSDLMPSDVLTVLCTLNLLEEPGEDAGDAATTECSYCKKTLDAESISPLERPIKCPECSDVIILKNWKDHGCLKKIANADGSLYGDYKKVLLNGQKHDLVLKIGDKELKAHKDILRARSRVFEACLTHDMTEKNSGVIQVPDCDPQAMELFISYMYCGTVETLDENNMFQLYYIADKYEMEDLKKKCRELIKKSLSLSNICVAIELAKKHSDDSLLYCATQYFKKNAIEIMRTVEWQSFLEANSTVGNELLIKAFEKSEK